MVEHPSLTGLKKEKVAEVSETELEEQLKRKITELENKNLSTKERLQQITELKDTLRELQEQQAVLQTREETELEQLRKKALELLIKRLGG